MLDGVFCMELNNVAQNKSPEIDIVFVHGLSSSADQAWRNAHNDLWPLWIRQVFPESRVVLLNYPSSAFFYAPSSRVNIQERARNIADLLPTIGIGLRQTIFICHSLGGILIKEILRSCIETGCSPSVAANTIGVIFLATPHAGSDIANLGKLMGSKLTSDLVKGSPYLLGLKDWFINHVASTPVFVSSYQETQLYNGVIVVDSESADPCCKGYNCIPLDENHSTICKPNSLNSDIFLRIKRDLQKAIEGVNGMTRNLMSIDEIIALPEITNQMYFDIVNYLNREFCAVESSQSATIISNPCGGSRPRCIIITKDVSLRQKVAPLAERWPERFRVEDGMIGEFVNSEFPSESEAEDYPPEAEEHPINEDFSNIPITDTEVLKVLVKYWQQNFANLVVDVKICGFWDDGQVIKAITAAHRFESKVRDWCERALSRIENAETVAENTVSASPSEQQDSKLKQSISDELLRIDYVHKIMNYLYSQNRFKIRMWDYSSTVDFNQAQSLECKIERIDYSRDIVVLVFDSPTRENQNFQIWRQNNKNLEFDWNFSRTEPLAIGETCISPASSEPLIVESINEKVFFPLIDKVTSLTSVIVLSGCEAMKGESGSPVSDIRGNIVGMIVGRTVHFGKPKYLAVTINVNEMRNSRSKGKALLSLEKDVD